jgi:hypothetical protein
MNDFIIPKFQLLEDIIEYDGPFISLGITEEKQYVFEIWCDIDDEKKYNLYAYVYPRYHDMQLLLAGKLDYYTTLLQADKFITFKYNGNYYDFQTISNHDFLAKYGPQPDFDIYPYLQKFIKEAAML